MSARNYALVGMSAPVLFWTTYLVMANLRPDYSMFTKAISELGSVDAPHRWTWNFLGYMLPGLMIAIFSYGLFKRVSPEATGRWTMIALSLSGLFMTLSGVFPGDFEHRTSATMVLHTIGSVGSYIFFLIAAFTYPRAMRESDFWKPSIQPTLTFTWITIIFGSWPMVFPEFPAVGQRVIFFFYFAWIFFMAIQLYRSPKVSGSGAEVK